MNAVWPLAMLLTFGLAAGAVPQKPADPAAAPECRQLLTELRRWSEDAVLVGHQESTLYGVYWSEGVDRSDIRSTTGSGPAVYGWDLLAIAPHGESDYEKKVLARLRQEIIAAHSRGAVNTISWHMGNPSTGGKYGDVTVGAGDMLPGGEGHGYYVEMLARAADFFASLQDVDGKPIPILFRPFHEMNGDWFWWRAQNPDDQQSLIELWQFTAQYLRKRVHNLLWVYSPGRFADNAEYLAAYPGDAWVDVLAVDDYDGFAIPENTATGVARLRQVVELAESRGKLSALAETGADTVPRADWFTQCLLRPIADDPVARRIAYLMLWRNANSGHFFTPPPRHAAAADFVRFRQDPFTIFEADLPDLFGGGRVGDGHAAWLAEASGVAIDRLWRQRRHPAWEVAPELADLFAGFDPAKENPRPLRAEVTTEPPPATIRLEPGLFTWSVPQAKLWLDGKRKSGIAGDLPALVHGGEEATRIDFVVDRPSPSVFAVTVKEVALSGRSGLQILVDEESALLQHLPVSAGSVQENRSPAWAVGEYAVVLAPGPHEVAAVNPGMEALRIAAVQLTTPPANLVIHGVVGDRQIRVWVENQTAYGELRQRFAVKSATVMLHDVPVGTWRVVTVGVESPPTTATAGPDGKLTLVLPPVQAGIGLRLEKE